MSNYYYDRSHKCYRKKRKKCDCDCYFESRYQTLTSGPLFRNANTDFIQVSALNQTDEPQTVTMRYRIIKILVMVMYTLLMDTFVES